MFIQSTTGTSSGIHCSCSITHSYKKKTDKTNFEKSVIAFSLQTVFLFFHFTMRNNKHFYLIPHTSLSRAMVHLYVLFTLNFLTH